MSILHMRNMSRKPEGHGSYISRGHNMLPIQKAMSILKLALLSLTAVHTVLLSFIPRPGCTREPAIKSKTNRHQPLHNYGLLHYNVPRPPAPTPTHKRNTVTRPTRPVVSNDAPRVHREVHAGTKKVQVRSRRETFTFRRLEDGTCREAAQSICALRSKAIAAAAHRQARPDGPDVGAAAGSVRNDAAVHPALPPYSC